MSKATHTARLKSIGETIEAMKTNVSYGTMYIKYLSYNEGSKIELTHHENDIYHCVICGWSLNSEMLTDIQPIAKEIEAPDGDFWVKWKAGDDRIEKISQDFLGNMLGEKSQSYSQLDFIRMVRDGIWLLVDAPEKKMRAYTADEWREWFDNDGVLVHKVSKARYKPCTIRPELSTDFIWRGEKRGGGWYSKRGIVDTYTDRNGLKFEKEIK